MPKSSQTPNTAQTPTRDEVLEGWLKQAGFRRLFLPGDFRQGLNSVSAESLVCHKTTDQCLVLTDETLTKSTTVTNISAGNYSTDPKYHPQDFKDQTVQIVSNNSLVDCDFCNGGSVYCRPSVNCLRCDGTRIERVYLFKESPITYYEQSGRSMQQKRRGKWKNKKGTITEKDKGKHGRGGTVTLEIDPLIIDCSDCQGAGRIGVQVCGTCSGHGDLEVPCPRCSGYGTEACDECQGSGQVPCEICGGAGVGVQGDILTRTYRSDTESSYQLPGLGPDEFKNGLSRKDFDPLEGELVSEGPQTPADPNTVLAQQSVHSYDVDANSYEYKGAEFSLNRITASGGKEKYVASNPPMSWAKAGIAAAVVGVPVLVGMALLMAL